MVERWRAALGRISPFMGIPDRKQAALDRVARAREERDDRRRDVMEAQDRFTEAIIAASLLGCSLREIQDAAGISFQRVSKIIRSALHSDDPPHT